jgi:LPXTG-motif cell wall-anchored protein
MITRAEGSINVEIWRKTADGSINEKCYDIQLQKPDWKTAVTDLPKKGVDKNGNEVEFLYYVKELKLDDYKVSYENNTGIVSGTITITNRQLVSYTLPGTGGSGTRVYTAVGMMFVLASGLLYIIKRRSVDKKGE